MLESLNALDHQLFLFLNHLDNPVCDFLMYWFSNKLTWIPLYGFLAYFVYKKFPQRFISIFVFVAIAISLSDQIASSVLKELVMRLRPCHDPVIGSQVHLVNNYCGGQYGFVSSHAANSFALVTFLVLLFKNEYRKLQWILVGWASIVSYSRIYLGVHFPGDVVCGAMLGALLGLFCEKGFQYYCLFANPKLKN